MLDESEVTFVKTNFSINALSNVDDKYFENFIMLYFDLGAVDLTSLRTFVLSSSLVQIDEQLKRILGRKNIDGRAAELIIANPTFFLFDSILKLAANPKFIELLELSQEFVFL